MLWSLDACAHALRLPFSFPTRRSSDLGTEDAGMEAAAVDPVSRRCTHGAVAGDHGHTVAVPHQAELGAIVRAGRGHAIERRSCLRSRPTMPASRGPSLVRPAPHSKTATPIISQLYGLSRPHNG